MSAARDAQQRRLAGTVRPDERDAFARLDREVDGVEDRGAPIGGVDAASSAGSSAHSSYPTRTRRRTMRKNGAPMMAVTTPTGMSPASRAARSA